MEKKGWIMRRGNGTHYLHTYAEEYARNNEVKNVVPLFESYDEKCDCGKEFLVPHFFSLSDSEGEKKCRIIEIGQELETATEKVFLGEANYALVEYQEHQIPYISRTIGNELWKQGVCFILPCGCQIKMGKAGVAAPYHFIDDQAERSAYHVAVSLVD